MRRSRTHHSVLAALLAALTLTPLACDRQPDLSALEAEVRRLHAAAIAAHLDGDAAALAAPIAPEYLMVANGAVDTLNAGEVEQMLGAYLAATEFSVYRDLVEPIVGISRDGSLAWVIAQVRVAGRRAGSADTTRAFDTRWAWITVYEREAGDWRRIADVSTRRPFGEES
jgi:hypothetical protein